MESIDTREFLRELGRTLFRRKGTLLLLVGCSVLGGTLYAYTFLPIYEASATLLVKVGRESSTPQADVSKPSPVVTTPNTAEVVNSEIEILEARFVAEEIVRSLGEKIFTPPPTEPKTLWQRSKRFLTQGVRSVVERVDSALIWLNLAEPLTARQKVILTLVKNLSAKVVQNTKTIRITFRSSNPQLATDIVKEALAIYLRHHIAIHQSANVVDFLAEQTRVFKARLDQAEESLKDFKVRSGISSLEEQRSHLLELNANIRNELRTVDVELARLNESVGGVKQLAADRGVDVRDGDITNPSSVIDALKLKLGDLRASRDTLVLKYTDGSPFIKSVEQEISDVETQLRKEEAQRAVVVDIAALKSKKAELERLSSGSLGELARLDRLEREQRELTRRVKENGDIYDTYFERAESARTLQALDTANITNISIIDPPYVPILPVRTIPFIPQRIFTIAVAFVVGLFIGLPVIAMQEMFDDSVHGRKQTRESSGVGGQGTTAEEQVHAATFDK